MQVLPKHPGLRLVLMSATLQADLFSQYFGGCPVIEVGPCPLLLCCWGRATLACLSARDSRPSLVLLSSV